MSKKLISESEKRRIQYLSGIISENQAQAPQQGGVPDIADEKIAATMDGAMKTVLSNLDSVLKNSLSKIGDKDGQIDIQETEGDDYSNCQIEFDESKSELISEGGLLGLAVSAPAIIQTGGKVAGWFGKKLNQQWLEKIGNKVAKSGEDLHHKYIHVIEKLIQPFMHTKSDEEIHKVAEMLMMGIVGGMFAMGVANPGALEAVKAKELGEFIVGKLGPMLGKIGIS